TPTFVDFLHNLPFYGLAVLCIDDANVQRIKSAVRKPVITYGTDAAADLRALDVAQHGTRMRFRAVRAQRRDIDVELAIPGNHNVLNALAAIAIGQELGIDDAAIVAGLAGFEGIGRRFELRGAVGVTGGEALLVDDYAHHPRELAATLQAAAGSWPERRRVAVFQPHRYTRTRDLLDDFAQVLERQDPLIITEVYPAGENPISGADGRALCRAIRARGKVDPIFVENLTDLPEILAAIVQPDDIILTLGAGDIGQVSRRLAHSQLAVPQRVRG
ncbi:MAG: Mur ligase family protein, partial [Gammaproteobacteria bacterium]|nr:Mur ligase family protein [Gammaproteobacteria bacterium]